MSANHAISGHKLTRTFGEVQALKEVSFTVPANSITGLLGRNGAGKTTLMSLITGQDRANSGTVTVLGRKPFEDSAAQRSMSYIRDNQRYPDDYKLHHAFRAASFFHPGWDQGLAEELAKKFNLPTKTVVTKYSRGQTSALSLILGMAARTPVTLLDEPYLGLDATARRMFYDLLIDEFTNHPRTFLVSTHLISEMENLLDHVIVLNRGEVVLETSAAAAISQFSTITGTGAALDQVLPALTGLTVLQRHDVGSLSSATLRGELTDAHRATLTNAGVEVAGTSLQDAVAALGELPGPGEETS